MKNLFLILFILPLVFVSCEPNDDNEDTSKALNDSIALGAGYSNDIFYSLEDGEVLSVSRNNWDIGFRTKAFSSSIIINSGAGVKLYEVSKDTNDWSEPVDTTGYSLQTRLDNSLEDWEVGAFSANMTTHPDYGWGIYDMSTHDLTGSAIYLIISKDGSARKIFIRRKNSIASTYYFVYSDIDGTNEHNVVLNCGNYPDKEFLYYSLSSNSPVDEQPAKNDWDLWFTKYYDPSVGPQLVTGILLNPSAKAMKVENVVHEAADTTMGSFSDKPAAIGYTWKQLDHQTFQYFIPENVTYFVKTGNKDVYKLYFTAFAGSSSGKTVFVKEKID